MGRHTNMDTSHSSLIHTLRCLSRGQTMARILMNRGLGEETLRGRVIDVGGGRAPDYFDYFKKEGVTLIEPVDGSISGIDFEADALPYQEQSVDTVVACNLLEHIYNHKRLLSEMHRVLKPGGQLIGFVPFWVGIHLDPHDYFRYTPESLERLLAEAGFRDIRVRAVGGGPILANFNTIVLSVPRIVRPPLYIWYATFDKLFVRLRPRSRQRNPLGFIFTAQV